MALKLWLRAGAFVALMTHLASLIYLISINIQLSSSELKAHGSLLITYCPSLCQSLNFSHFELLFQNHWSSFKQIWHKSYMGKGHSFFLADEGQHPSP
jgi:hypothetical protein